MNTSGDAPIIVSPEEDEDRDGAAIIGWIYLALIMAIFLAIALWSRGLSDTQPTVALGLDQTTTTTAAVALDPAVVNVSIDRKMATLTGSVPDEGARAQFVRIAEEQFGNGNVVDELTVDPGVDLATGTINFSGIADEGDIAPEALQLAAGADLGLSNGAFDVEFVRPEFEPAAVDFAIGELPVVLVGRVPSDSDRDRLLQSAEAVYGEGNVDVSQVLVEPSDIEGADFTISGLTAPGDARSADLMQVLQTDFRSANVTDSSEVDVSDQALEDFEERLRAILVENPILFNTGTSTISGEGEANLAVIAENIIAVPDREVEIVGHTDDTGGATVNQTLSENRAIAVKEALVELGVEEARLTTRGAGPDEPEVPNTSPENRARNRRIEFSFERG